VMEYTRKVGGAPGPDSLPGAGPERTLAFGAVFLPRPDAQDKGVQDNVRPARCLSSAGRAQRCSASPACAQRRHVRNACQCMSENNGLVLSDCQQGGHGRGTRLLRLHRVCSAHSAAVQIMPEEARQDRAWCTARRIFAWDIVNVRHA